MGIIGKSWVYTGSKSHNGAKPATEEIETYIPVNALMDYNVGSREIEEDLKSNLPQVKRPVPKKHSVASLNTLAKTLEKKATKVRQEVSMKRKALQRLEKAKSRLDINYGNLFELNVEIEKKHKR